MTYTPGPWRVVPPPTHDNGNPWRVAGGDHTIAIIPNRPREADARLIAAAPELLESLRRIVQLAEDDEHEPTYAWKDAFAAGAAAIAKAEGRDS